MQGQALGHSSNDDTNTILTRAGHVKCRCSFASCKNVAR